LQQASAPLRAVREGHGFDAERLSGWMAERLPEFRPPLRVDQLAGGASNPTFLLTDANGRRYVMRKKPPGTLLASAHQVDREYRVMAALRDTDVPVPNVRALCDDPAVIGTAFYVMDYLDGRILRDPLLGGHGPEDRAAIYDELNAVMARLHSVDHEAIGLGDYGRPGNYFARQIGRFTRQYRDAETETIPAMERLIDNLPARIPDEPSVSIAHGDYRLENVMFHPSEPRIIGVLDWELSTIGHPLADLAYNCIFYHSDAARAAFASGAAAGLPSEADYVAAYCRRTGRDAIGDWPFYMAFATFRLASIAQGVYARALAGTTPTEDYDTNGAPNMAALSLSLLEGRA
jgi:aminoglycoside phosphotransferase (APT) family kinase protein